MQSLTFSICLVLVTWYDGFGGRHHTGITVQDSKIVVAGVIVTPSHGRWNRPFS